MTSTTRSPHTSRAHASRLVPRLLLLLVLLPAAIAFLPATALATQPLPDAELHASPNVTGPRGGPVEWPTSRINYMFELDQLAAFMDTWQEDTPGANFGGMIEAEAGPLGGVIQTDNTLEAIWVWSKYTELTGRTTYLQNIADAWIYCQNFPPWLEEGPVAGYYRAHNCAWALTAEMAYRQATGDTAFLTYAQTSADWIVAHPLTITQSQRLNAFVQGWTSGNLYLYGEERSNNGWMNSALTLAQAVKGFIDPNPTANLALENWAMSSGTMVWGICNSLYRANPIAGALWIAGNGALVDTFQPWYDVPADSFDWDNSWNVAYLNAHFAMYDVTGDPQWFTNGENLTRQLLSYDDADDDGGIQGTTQDPNTEDMSWVSCYLTKFGVVRMIGEPNDVDAGTLAFESLSDGQQILWPVGAPIPITAQVTNFGLDDLQDVVVHLDGPVTGEVTLDLAFAERASVELHAGWTPAAPGEYVFTVSTEIAGDEDAANDALTITVQVTNPAAVEGGPLASQGLRLEPPSPSPFQSSTRVAFELPADSPARVELFGADGRNLRDWRFESGPARRVSVVWDGYDRHARRASAGVYYLRGSAGSRTGVTRVVLVR